MKLEQQIRDIVEKETRDNGAGLLYRTPIVGYADAHDPRYRELDNLIGNPQTLPEEILPGAETVVVFFLPFSKEALEELKKGRRISQKWSDYYTGTNQLLKHITGTLAGFLEEQGYPSAQIPPTDDFDLPTLTAKWSHKSSAVIAGIGSFGLNRLLVTEQGTAGRLGSFVTAAKLEPTSGEDVTYCLYYGKGACRACMDRCPSGAISKDGFDRFRCNAYLDGKNIHDLQQGCGLCSSGPCAMKGFRERRQP